MKMGKWLFAAGVLLLGVAPFTFAQTETLQINDPPSSNVLDDIYVGSYSATNTQTGANVQITCDDFMDESDYNVATYAVNSFNSLGSTLWGSELLADHVSMQTITQMYSAAAWLTLGMFNQTGQTQGFYSYAIWAVFDPSGVASWLTSAGDSGACNAVFGAGSWGAGGCTAGKGGLVGTALGNTYSSGEFANFLILTPPTSGCVPGSCKEQEFFLLVPEGGSAALYLLFAGMSCFGGLFFRQRRQMAGVRPDVV
jgi:hypothetical protein